MLIKYTVKKILIFNFFNVIIGMQTPELCIIFHI